MNLTESLNVALPDIPAQTKEFHPRIHPKLVGREHIVDGKPQIMAVISGKTWLYTFTLLEWDLVQLFDGKRSHQEVSDLFYEQTGTRFSASEIRDFAGNLDTMEFWYKTPFEESAMFAYRAKERRGQHAKKKSKFGDLSKIHFNAWDPDLFFDRIHPYLKFFYTRWCTILTLFAFAFMGWIFFERWDEIGRDTLQFYTFTDKGFWDIVEFWGLACTVLFVHEAAHGLSCKHYGGHVHQMGFQLIYLTPAFYTDATEAWVYGNKGQRLVTIVSGAWSEMVICAIATPIWWGTPAGSLVHEWAYKLVLITGLGVIFFNWNPFIKLDGYFLLTEMLGVPELKEESTVYVSSWVKKHIWKLPVEVPFVPKRRRLGYVVYAVLSGIYSYSLLLIVARLAGNIFHRWIPDWSFLAALAVGYLVFKSRITALVRFMKTLYLDKKDRILAWLTPQRRIVAGVVAVILLFLPLWRETVEGRFLLEPVNRAVLRSAVPGTVTETNADEGKKVAAGEMLIRLRNLSLESEAAQTRAHSAVAAARATEAQLRYASFGVADRERQQLVERTRLLDQQIAMLRISSPIAGQVMTPRVTDLLGSRVEPGTELVEVADLSILRARIYVPEFAMRKTHVGAPARLLPDAEVFSTAGTVKSMAPASSEIEEGLMQKAQYKGIRSSTFYVVNIEVENPKHELHAGMAGTALIDVGRRSIAGLAAEAAWDFLRRKVW